ncbi:hypothetical protein ACM66B_000117 [Microbotryomycetes sp. NB124-2]
MGLAHFVHRCPQLGGSLHDVQEWCVRKSGTCCGVCPNQLATVGSRAGLTAVVFFSSAVIVFDGQEAPFNFMTILAQALAYLLAVLQAGFRGNQISKFHAYYALLGSLGFLAPLSAVALTPNSLMYGRHYAKPGEILVPAVRPTGRVKRKKLKAHALGESPTASSTAPLSVAAVIARLNQERERRPRVAKPRASDVEQGLNGASSPDQAFSLGQPMLAPTSQMSHTSSERRPTYPDDSRSSTYTPDSDSIENSALNESTSATASSTLRASSHHHYDDHLKISFGPDQDISFPIERRRSFKYPDTPEFGPGGEASPSRIIGIGTHSASTPLLQPRRRSRRKLTKSEPERKAKTPRFELNEAQREVAEQLLKDQAWRRRGYIAGFLTLWGVWVFTFLFVVDVGGTRLIKFSQTDCEDPDGTTLLFAANITLLVIGLVVFALFVANFYNHWLSHTTAKPFIYSRKGSRLQKCIVPGTISLLVFALWQIFLWTSYSRAAAPESSLLSADVNTHPSHF